MLIEEFKDLVQDTYVFPATIGTIASLPGGAIPKRSWRKIVPRRGETKFSKDAIEDSARIGWRTTAAVGRGGRKEVLDERPLFVSQVHEGGIGEWGPSFPLRM
jgi:hypothetical protein